MIWFSCPPGTGRETPASGLAMQLRHARYTDGYQTVWFYQRLSAACARHGQALNDRT